MIWKLVWIIAFDWVVQGTASKLNLNRFFQKLIFPQSETISPSLNDGLLNDTCLPRWTFSGTAGRLKSLETYRANPEKWRVRTVTLKSPHQQKKTLIRNLGRISIISNLFHCLRASLSTFLSSLYRLRNQWCLIISVHGFLQIWRFTSL